MNSWAILTVAILLEVLGSTAMKLSEGFTKLWPSVCMGICYLLSLAALNFALKKIELSIAYAVWGGVGTALIAMLGIAVFHESATTLKLLSLLLVIAGVVGLHIGSRV